MIAADFGGRYTFAADSIAESSQFTFVTDFILNCGHYTFAAHSIAEQVGVASFAPCANFAADSVKRNMSCRVKEEERKEILKVFYFIIFIFIKKNFRNIYS